MSSDARVEPGTREALGTISDGALGTRGLVRYYGKWRVVDDVSLTVRRGEVVGLLGPNGAGKTTTFHMITGLLTPSAGEILLDGDNITRLPMHRRARLGIGYLSQEPSIFRRMTVRENLMAVLETLSLSRAEREERCSELLAELDLGHLADRRGYHLSGGERRRTEIARALVTRPSFMLLDEPFVGIDPIAVAEIQQNILRLKARGLGLLITDHSVRETLMATDRVYLMYEGRIRLEGQARELADHPLAREIYLGKDFRL
ncbi:MAG: LPS export ABC transporter ATP-binding protein [Candidatus Eisenbacteria sp.]|nr:LPS export ABC transporter ATP-binding protein [Candidatus Eisenbacteria bacterium]